MSKKLRSTLTGLLGLGMTLSSVGTVMAAPANDINGHWAAKQLQEWVDKGDLNGYGDGSVKPNRSITRAEFISLVNRMFGYKDIAQVSFTDLPAGNWAYADIAKAVSAGYIQGYENNTIRPSANVTRQEAASIIYKVLGLQAGQIDSLNQYKDAKQIAAWSQDSISAVISKNIMHGYTDGTFAPQKNLTRAEAVVLLDAALATKKLTETVTYDQAGTYGSAQEAKVIHGNVVINVPGVVLENVEIEGDLTLAAVVGSGDVTLKNVKVHGTTNVQGGGENSIHFVDSVLVNIVINKKDGTVRIVAEGSTTAETVIVQSSAKIEEDKVSGVGFTDVELSKELPANAKVVLNGKFDDVDVYAASVSVQLQRGSIENIHVDGTAQNSSIEISSGAKLAKLVLDAVTKILGAGQIQTAVINEGAKGSSFQTKPSQIEGTAKDSIIVNTPAPSNSGSGVSTGGTSNGGSTEEGSTPHPVIDRVSVSTMTELQSALAAGVKDITIASELTSGTNTVTVPAGITLRDYWKIGSGNKVIVNAGGMLRWGTGTTNNLLVGKANSTAHLQLATGATLTIMGGASGKIASYELNGTGTVQQQAENPFVVGASEIFTITVGSTLKVAGAVDTDLANVKPVLSVDANGGKLVVNGTLHLLQGSRVVLGAGYSSIENTGTITNDAGTYDGSIITGVVGILDSNHNIIGIDAASISTMAGLQSALAAGVKDITIASDLSEGTDKVTIPAGVTLRDYWKIGSGNQVVVNAGAMLRWSAGTADNLLVGDADSMAHLQLATGALTITGGASGEIGSYELNGTGTVQQQAKNPFVVGASQTFTIAVGSKLSVAKAVDTDLATVKPVLSVDANGGKLVVNGTLELLKGSRVVLGAGLSSIEKTGTITNNAGIYNGSVITGVVGILDSNHNVIDFDAASVNTMAELQSALAFGVKDITIASDLSEGTDKVTVPAGVTLRDYWKIGSGNQVVVNAGAMLRWSAETADNLLVGDADSMANLQLATGALTITGGASGEIGSYELNGTGTVQQQAKNPFVVGASQTFTIAAGSKLQVAKATDEDLATVKPVLSVDAHGGKLVVKGTLELLEGSRVVLGAGFSSIEKTETGTILNNAGEYNGSTAAGVVGILDSNHNVIDFDAASVNTMAELQSALAFGVKDITIARELPAGTNKVTVPAGVTLRDYWKIGSGNQVVVNAGGMLRWGTDTTDNLLVGDADSAANLQLATGATLTITGGENGKIASYELNGTGTVQQQAENPFVVGASETFTIAEGSKLQVAKATDEDLATVKPVLSVDAHSGKLVVKGTLELLEGSRVVLGAGLSSIERTGTITNNAGIYNGSVITGVVGILDSNHNVIDINVIDIDVASVNTMAELQSALAAGVKDITIASDLSEGTDTVTVPAGVTLRDYWKIGSGNQVVVNAGGMLRWGTGSDNLLVGDTNSAANLQLATGATLTITGGASGKIESYELNGTGTVQQQAENPFVVGASEIFTIAAGSTLKVAGAVDTDLSNVKPVLSVDANGGKLVVNGTLHLLQGSRVVLGAGYSSIENTGTITNNAGIYDGSDISGVVGILDSNHNVVEFLQ